MLYLIESSQAKQCARVNIRVGMSIVGNIEMIETYSSQMLSAFIYLRCFGINYPLMEWTRISIGGAATFVRLEEWPSNKE